MARLTTEAYRCAWLGLLIGQAWLAFYWFGPWAERWEQFTSPAPVLDGRHPLHFSQAWLGLESFIETGSTNCYDPSFQAGYPKTPVFDGSCRPAEASLILGHWLGIPNLAARYKLGLLLVACLVPGVFFAAAWGLDLPPSGRVVCGFLGCLIFWAKPVQTMFLAGSVDLILAGLAGLLYLGGLSRYDHHPGPAAWGMAAFAGALGWFAQPVVWLGMIILASGHYLIAAPRHGLVWHAGRLGISLAGLLPNAPWLTQWFKYWWLRTPTLDDCDSLPCAVTTLGHWQDYPALLGWNLTGWSLLILGLPGTIWLIRQGRGGTAAGATAAALAALFLARYAQATPTLQMLHADRAVWFSVALLSLPTAAVIATWWQRTTAEPGLVLVTGWLLPVLFALNIVTVPRLQIGLSLQQETLIRELRDATTPDARILWEDEDPSRPGWNWSALLPRFMNRSFLGGLDPAARIDHAFLGMRLGRLNGRRFEEWTPAARQAFTQRYNISWVVTHSAAAATWWATDPRAREVQRWETTQGTRILFRIERTPNWFLSGQGEVERIDAHRIELRNVVGDAQQEVVLSLHYQPGLRVAPLYQRVEPAKDALDPVPLMKLKLTGPTSRLILVWDP